MKSAPVNREFFMGRVEEVEAAELLATVWSWPAGRELLVELPRDEYLDSGSPSEGDLVVVWTWQEIPEAGKVVDHRFARVIPEELTEEQKSDLLIRLDDDT